MLHVLGAFDFLCLLSVQHSRLICSCVRLVLIQIITNCNEILREKEHMPCNWDKKQDRQTTLRGQHSNRQVSGMSNELIYIHCSTAWHINGTAGKQMCFLYVLLKHSESCLRGSHTTEEMIASFMADCFHCLSLEEARQWLEDEWRGFTRGDSAVIPPAKRVRYHNRGSLKQSVLGGLHFIKYLLNI